MKKQLTKNVMTLLLLLMVSLVALPATYAELITAQDQADTFIETALPVDLSKYDISFIKQSTLELSHGRIVDTVRYTFNSVEGTFDLICNIENNVMRYCQVSQKNGSAISDKQYTNPLDAVKSFLEKYQEYTKIDSTNLIAMLNDVDVTKNSTTIIDSTKLSISNSVFAGKELTRFKWTYTVNGADYTSLQVGFLKNGILDTLRDTRAVYTVGDTSVNISREQAIDIALKHLPNYAYNMPNNVIISGFNVTEDKITAELAAHPVNYPEMRPYWHVKMPLNQTYPGSVHGIAVFIWANSGEIISCSNIAFGGVDYSDYRSDTEFNQSSEGDNFSSSNPLPQDPSLVIGIAIAIIGLATTSALIIKKREK